MEEIIKMNNIVKKYYIDTPNELEILKGVSFSVQQREFVSIVGESGSGKSTLMNIIGALDRPTSGEYLFEGKDIGSVNDRELSRIRNEKIGFVFQNFNLIPRMTAQKNVEIPMMYAGISRAERTKRAKELLELVGMEKRSNHQPNELSGGQKQRVAIARSLVNNPSILLADEPTGALDSQTGHMIMDLFHRLHKEHGMTIVLITHSQELAKETERIVTISDGMIINDEQNSIKKQ
ncbi:MAG: ABC transporter ATP-binding protein [Acutalibacteraceae bacterium]|nr:ABC transporter ATP-binding protein [Acutalibacteraceae bacterium]